VEICNGDIFYFKIELFLEQQNGFCSSFGSSAHGGSAPPLFQSFELDQTCFKNMLNL